MFKNLSIIPFVCMIIAFVSLQGYLNNYGLATRSSMTTISAIIVLFIGVVAIYGLFTKQKWSPISFVVWMGYGVVNNLIYFFTFKNRPLWNLLVAALALFLITLFLYKKLVKDIQPKAPESDANN